VNLSGWGADTNGTLLLASDEAWDNQIEINREVRPLRNTPFEFIHDLNIIFDGKSATGALAQSIDSTPIDSTPIDPILLAPASEVSVEPGVFEASQLAKRKAQAQLEAQKVKKQKARSTRNDTLEKVIQAIEKKGQNVPGKEEKERAVKVLEAVYSDLSEQDFLRVLFKLNDPQLVISFNALLPGERRDSMVRALATE